MIHCITIISGAQTGVDRGALDAALESSAPCGGWVPMGRKADDGVIPDRYPVQELNGGYPQRTRQNVVDSDGTVLIYFSELTGGTQLTLRFCRNKQKPFLLIDAGELSAGRAAERVCEFIRKKAIRVLNVAGPRQATAAGARDYSYAVIAQLLTGFG